MGLLMRKFLFGVVMVFVLSLQGEGRADPKAPATNFESHAYLYQADPSDPSFTHIPVNYAEVIVQQPGTLRYLGCDLSDGRKVPATPEEFQAFVADPLCRTIDVTTSGKFIYQRKSDRFLFLYSSTDLGPIDDGGTGPGVYAITGTYSVIFDPHRTGSMQIIGTMVSYADGENPKISTYRTAELLNYDALIQYPEITEKPIGK